MKIVITCVPMTMQLSDLKSSRDDILEKQGKSQLSFQSDVEILRRWMEKQPHLPADQLQNEFLEIILIKNKYSVEKAKNKIENYCTLKSLQRYRYLSEIELTVPSSEPQFYIPLPNLTDDYHRIVVLKIFDPEKWDMKGDVATGFVIREILSRFDYNDGEIFIFDWSECTPTIISKLRVNILIDVVNLVFKAYSARIKEIHLINKIASTLFNWAKPFLSSKLVSRVKLHENISTVAEILPSKCLPKDYGGELKSLHEFISDFFEIMLLKNKFSIEKTKRKFENYCTMKGLQRYRYIFEGDIGVPSTLPQFYFPLPKLTDKFYRIVIGKIFDQEEWNIQRDAVNAIVGREISIRFDYNDGEILVLDYSNCTLKFLSKLRLNVLSDILNLILNAHSSKLKEVHIISKFSSTIFNWAKPVLPTKLASRIKVHDSIEALARILPLNCLPKDYGGELKSIQEFRDDFDLIYANHRQDIIEYMNTKSREELRQGGYVEEEMQGTFKQLNID